MIEQYYTDYPAEKIGRGNPYSRCSSCGRSCPEINGRLDGHYDNCEWAKKKLEKLEIEQTLNEIYARAKGGEYGFMDVEQVEYDLRNNPISALDDILDNVRVLAEKLDIKLCS